MSNIKNWTILKLKFLFSARMGGAWGDEPVEDNSIVCLRAADFETEKGRHKKTDLTRRSFKKDEIINKSLVEGDLIIEKSGGGENQPVGRVVRFNLDEPALCSNFLEVLRPNKKVLYPEFGAYKLYSLWTTRLTMLSIKQTTGIQNLDISDYLENKVPIPSIELQISIVKYLNKEVDFIDNLIETKEKLLQLLSEKRQALILPAITKGLNSSVIMKTSGVEYLGNVPEHWIVERTRWLFKERNERSETGDEEMLSVSHITGVTPRSEKNVNMFEAESNEGYKKCFPGDLVINTLWAWMGAMGIAPVEGIVSPAYHVYTPTSAILSAYIDAIVRLPIFATEVTRYSKGVWSSRLRLYPEGFYEVYLPVPPIEEQVQIVKFIKDETEKIDRLKKVTEKSIEFLKERRIALITAAVTGQIKIPSTYENS
jgi:type I restriction enzyme S subunit